jgi:hypothetical protein
VPVGGAGMGAVGMDGMHPEQVAAGLRALAAEARAGAARVAAVESVRWRSIAAERFRAALRHEAALGRRCADLLDSAAAAFAAHARAIGDGR